MALEMLQKNPGDNMMIHNLSSVYNRNGEKEKAIDFFLKVLEMNPAHTTARIGLAVIYESNGDYESAIDQLELLKFYEPGKPQIDNQIKNLKRLIAAKKSNPTEIDKTN
jgi:tetratricopeptide (TPR) repeat protein